MSLKTPWAPLAFDWYADEEVKSPTLGPALWPWILGRVIKGQGVISEEELDPEEAVDNVGLVRFAEELARAVKANPDLDVQQWVVAQAATAFKAFRTPRSSRRQPLMVPAMSQRDLGGRNASGSYGGNFQTKRGYTAKGFREWMGKFTRIEVTFGPAPATPSVAPPPPPPPSSPPPPPAGAPPESSSAPPTANEAHTAASRFANLFKAYWPAVSLKRGWWDENLELLIRHGEANVADLCQKARQRSATHPNYVIACLQRIAPAPALSSASSSHASPAPRAHKGAVPSYDEWSNVQW